MDEQAPTPPSHTNSPAQQFHQRAFTLPALSAGHPSHGYPPPGQTSHGHPPPGQTSPGQPSPGQPSVGQSSVGQSSFVQVLPSPDPSEDGSRQRFPSSATLHSNTAQDQSHHAAQAYLHKQLKRVSTADMSANQSQKRRSLDGPVIPSIHTVMTPINSSPIPQRSLNVAQLASNGNLQFTGDSRPGSSTSPALPQASSPVQQRSGLCAEYLACAQAGTPGIEEQLSPGRQPPIVQARIKTLLDAIKCEDVRFLFLHQIVCLSSHQPTLIPEGLRSQPTFDPVIRWLSGLLGSPQRLPTPTLAYFASFPQALPVFAQRAPNDYTAQINDLGHFFHLMTYSGFAFLDTCATHSWPPPTADIFRYTGAKSMSLRTVMFRHLARTIWGKLPEPSALSLMQRAEPLHRKDQNAFRHRAWQNLAEVSKEELQVNGLIRQYAIEAFSQAGVPMAVPRSHVVTTPVQPHSPSMSSGPPVRITSAPLPPPQQPVRSFTAPGVIMHAPVARPVPKVPGMEASIYPKAPFTIQSVAQPQPGHALHQLWSRTPEPGPDTKSTPKPDLCQSIESFAVAPRLLRANEIIHTFTFDLSEQQLARLYKDTTTAEGRNKRHFRNGGTLLRIKLSNKSFPRNSAGRTSIDISEWVVADPYWPPNILVEVNKKSIELRRKIQWAKDLPADITGNDFAGERYLVLGKNTVEVMFNTVHTDPSIQTYSFAIEVVPTRTAAALKAKVRETVQDASVTLGQIKHRLGGDESDEIQSVGGTITLDLFEPFTTSKMFDVPVRSQGCQHLDCFDLDTFIEARYRRKSGYPSAIDDWRCPLCRADARPQKLFVDGFLVDVRRELAEQNKLDCRYVVVKEDGSWEPKVMAQNKEASEPAKTPDAKSVVQPAGPKAPIEVIDLDDD